MNLIPKLALSTLMALGASTAILVSVSPSDAAAQIVDCDCGTQNCRSSLRKKRRCPSCDNEICELAISTGKEKKTCFKVETKKICIPAVRLPWQKCAPQPCGISRTIRVLKKHSFECPKCEYKWNVVEGNPVSPACDQVQIIPVGKSGLQSPAQFSPIIDISNTRSYYEPLSTNRTRPIAGNSLGIVPQTIQSPKPFQNR